MMVLVPPMKLKGETSGVMTLSCGTDNQGNTHLLDRMLTTKYPLGIILMELAHQMRKRNIVLRADWLPRLENEEADALTNFDFRHFDLANRIDVELERLEFGVMDSLFRVGGGLHCQARAREAQEEVPASARDQEEERAGREPACRY